MRPPAGNPSIRGKTNPCAQPPTCARGDQFTVADKENLGDTLGLLVYIVAKDKMLIRYDPNSDGRKEHRILTKKEFEEYLKKAEELASKDRDTWDVH